MDSFFALTKTLVIRAFIIYYVTSFFRRPSQPPPNKTAEPSTPTFPEENFPEEIFQKDTSVILYLYVTEKKHIEEFDPTNPSWYRDHLAYGNKRAVIKNGAYCVEENFTITVHKENGPLYLHAFITRRGESPNRQQRNYGNNQVQLANKHKRSSRIKWLGETNMVCGRWSRFLWHVSICCYSHLFLCGFSYRLKNRASSLKNICVVSVKYKVG